MKKFGKEHPNFKGNEWRIDGRELYKKYEDRVNG